MCDHVYATLVFAAFKFGIHKSVKKLMCDKKIPLELREKLPVIYDEDGIVAIPLLATRDGAVSKNNSNATVIQFYLH